MIINHNLSALNANRVLKFKNVEVDTSMRKLASGMKITRAGDDASGLAVSEKMRAQIRGLNRAEANAGDAISFIQVAEGYLQESQNVLQRIRELSVQAGNGIYTAEDRMMIQVEISQLVDEVDRIASHAQFNGLNMLTGRFANAAAMGGTPTASVWFHIGANMDQRIRGFIGTMTSIGLKLENYNTHEIISVSSQDTSNQAIGVVDEALKKVSKQRADLGAYMNRLEIATRSLAIGAENMQAAESAIRDVDMADEVSKLVKNQILSQAGTAMVAQANTKPNTVLQLLR